MDMIQTGMSMSNFRGVDIDIENNFFFDVEDFAASMGVDPGSVTREDMVEAIKNCSFRELLHDWNFEMGMTISVDGEVVASG